MKNNKKITHTLKKQEQSIKSKDFVHNQFINKIKVNSKAVNTLVEKTNFLKEIENNEQILNMLSVERLQKLEKYYDNKIKENEEKIKVLKAKK